MDIAIIGTGNVGGVLATHWSKAGHNIILGVRDLQQFKGKELLNNKNTKGMLVVDAVAEAQVVLIATPAPAAVEVARSLGITEGKIIIDAMNVVMGRGPEGFTNTADAILANTHSRDVVKCSNTMGYNNMKNPNYGDLSIDAFVAGDSEIGKETAITLAKAAGFENCYDIGGNDKFELMEQFAFFWINLAMKQGHGREIGFKLLKR